MLLDRLFDLMFPLKLSGDGMNRKVVIRALPFAASMLAASSAFAGDTTYAYDAQAQLVSVSRAAGSASYAYDKAGNRTRITAGAGSTQSSQPTSQGGDKGASASTDGVSSEVPAGFVLPQLLPGSPFASPQKAATSKTADR